MRLIDADALWENCKKHYFDNSTVMRCVEILLDNAPTIEPERKKGQWIDMRKEYDSNVWECSECHFPLLLDNDFTPMENEYRYCPRCGSRMESEAE